MTGRCWLLHSPLQVKFRLLTCPFVLGFIWDFPSECEKKIKDKHKIYTNSDWCRKILRLLLRASDSNVITIQEARDLSVLKVEELIGSLMTYEIGLNQYEEKEVLKKKKEKGIALKADIKEESDRNNEDVESKLSDFEMAFLARKFRNFMKNRRHFPRKRNTNRKESSKEVEKEGEKKNANLF